MSNFQSFDSMEEMYAYMQQAEEQANANLDPRQIELRDDTEHPRWWVRPYPEAGVLIFGHAWSTARCAESEDPATVRDITRRRTERGYLFGMAYSVIEPDGEPGDTHVANVMPISQQAFKEAEAHGWQAIKADPLVALMLPAEVLAEKTTPTLVAELAALGGGSDD